jgi:hypothetical protein
VAELIGDQLGIDTGLTRKTGMRASHDLKRRPLELDGFQPRRQEPPPGIVAPEWCGELCRGKQRLIGRAPDCATPVMNDSPMMCQTWTTCRYIRTASVRCLSEGDKICNHYKT